LQLPDLISLLIFNFAAQSTQCREKLEPESLSSLMVDPASRYFSLWAKGEEFSCDGRWRQRFCNTDRGSFWLSAVALS
jgi:hypothetical protein